MIKKDEPTRSLAKSLEQQHIRLKAALRGTKYDPHVLEHDDYRTQSMRVIDGRTFNIISKITVEEMEDLEDATEILKAVRPNKVKKKPQDDEVELVTDPSSMDNNEVEKDLMDHLIVVNELLKEIAKRPGLHAVIGVEATDEYPYVYASMFRKLWEVGE